MQQEEDLDDIEQHVSETEQDFQHILMFPES